MHASLALESWIGASQTAGQHLVRRVPTASPDDTAATAREKLLGHLFDCTEAVYLVAENHRLMGLVPLPVLLGAPREAKLRELATVPAPAALPDTDQEHVASRAIAHGLALTALAVAI